MSLRFKKSFTFDIKNLPFRLNTFRVQQKLHDHHDTIHMSRQQEENAKIPFGTELFFLLDAIIRRLGSFSTWNVGCGGKLPRNALHETPKDIDGSLGLGVYYRRINGI